MTMLILGIALAFNLIVIIFKVKRMHRYLDALTDATLLVLTAMVFSGSAMALSIGTIGSAIVSVYLLIDPIEIGNPFKQKKKLRRA